MKKQEIIYFFSKKRLYIFFPSKALGTEAEERREKKEVYIVNYNLFTISYI